jgi:hypothetical protein
MTTSALINEFKRQYCHLEEFGLTVIGVYCEKDSGREGELQIGISKSCEDNDEIIPAESHLSVMHPFIFDNRKEIKAVLKEPDMSYADVLDAICLGNFTIYSAEYEEWRLLRLTK